MSKRSTSSGVHVSKLLELLPPSIFEDLAEEFAADKWVKKLKAEAIFKLVLFTLLDSERMSLRILESNTRDPYFRSLYPVLNEHVRWTGIRDRLIHLPVAYCARLYEVVYKEIEALYSEKTLTKYHIKRYDSTMIATFSHLLEGMHVGNTKHGKTQVKLTTEMSDDLLLRMHIHTGQVGEETALKAAIFDAAHGDGDIVVFDRGMQSRETFAALEQAQTNFVSRLNSKVRYKLLRQSPITEGQEAPGLEFVCDNIVYLYKGGNAVVETELRLIQYRDPQTGKILSFITNLNTLPASVIAQIYRLRWDIEVLFRFMKQELNLTHFVCNDLNAIQVMLYFTIITAMLVLTYKKHNAMRSYKLAKIQFFKELTSTLMLDLLESPEGVEQLKLNLKQFVQRE